MTRRNVAALVGAVVVATSLTGCFVQSPEQPTVTVSVTPSPTLSLSQPERPPSTVEPWPDYGDFAVDSNKAIVPAYNLSTEQRWDDYDHMLRIANMAQARWVGSWEDNTRVAGLTRDVFKKAATADRIGLVAYQGMRDYPCERAVAEPELELAYQDRTAAVVEDLADTGADAWIFLEPALLETLGTCEGDPRGEWLDTASGGLAAAGAAVYLDATGLTGRTPADAAATVADLNLGPVAGFSLNVGGHRPTDEVVAWGKEFLAELESLGVDVNARREGIDPGQPGLGLVVDTSRNSVPLEGEQCNAAQAGIGAAPRLVGEGVLDALAWIKRPGESDGPCNGGFQVGQFDQAKALELARLGQLD